MSGELGRIGVWSDLDTLPIDRMRDYGGAVEDLGFSALWVSELVGREPFTLLALLAGTTHKIELGTSIAVIYGRDAVTARGAAMTLHEATGGRFLLGLGISHPHIVTKLRSHEYAPPVAEMHRYLEAYRRAPYRGPMPDHAARAEPPVIIAALRTRMLKLAGTEADGAFPYLVGTDRVRWMRTVLDDAAKAAARPRPMLYVTLPVSLEPNMSLARSYARAYLSPYLRTPVYQASWAEQGFETSDWQQPGTDRFVEALIACGPVPALVTRIEGLLAVGADHVALIPLAPDGSSEHLPTLEAIAGAMPLV